MYIIVYDNWYVKNYLSIQQHNMCMYLHPFGRSLTFLNVTHALYIPILDPSLSLVIVSVQLMNIAIKPMANGYKIVMKHFLSQDQYDMTYLQ